MKFRVLSVILFCLGLFCLGQSPRAQLTMMGVGAVGSGSGLTGTVTFDNKSLGFTSASSATTVTDASLGVGSGTDRGLIVFLSQVGGAADISSPSVTFNGASMVQVATATLGSGFVQFIFGLRNPSSGTFAAIANWTNAEQIAIATISFAGVNQASNAAAFVNATNATGTSTTSSVTVTSATNDIAVATHLIVSQNCTGVNNNIIQTNNSGLRSGQGSNYAAGPTPTFTCTTSGSSQWTSLGIDLAHD